MTTTKRVRVTRAAVERELWLFLLLPICLAGGTVAAQTVDSSSETRTVDIVGRRDAGTEHQANGIAWLAKSRSLTLIDAPSLTFWEPGRLEDLTGLLPGTVVEPLNAGISTAFKVRGFSVSRLHYGGLPDIQRMFNRDLFTIERIEFVRGPSAALLGITSPGGAFNYIGKRPLDVDRTTMGLSVGGHDHLRATVDHSGGLEKHGQGLRFRLVGAVEDGKQPWADLPLRRQTGMLVVERRYALGEFGVDLQVARNQTPFSFGTVITNRGSSGSPALPAHVAWDRLFVLDGGAPADRRYRDLRVRWKHTLTTGLDVHVDVGNARVRRDETLIGYWTVTSPDTVSSYYTEYQDRYRQTSGRMQLRLRTTVLGLPHDLSAGLDVYRQRFHFQGVQNIGKFMTDIEAPDFSAVVPQALDLSSRYNDERIVERGAWVADRIELGRAVELSGAVRQQRYAIESDRSGVGRTIVAESSGRSWFAGASWQFSDGWRSWASVATGIEPNRGRTTSGDFLPPQRSRQVEMGAERATDQVKAALSLWRIDLNNLAMTDPLDRTAVISSGRRQVDGLELSGTWRPTQWAVSANGSYQRSRHVVKTSASLGDRFVGVPDVSGGLQLTGPFNLGRQLVGTAGLSVVAVGSRMGDAANTVRVPGYVRLDTSVSAMWASLRWSIGVRNLGNIRYVQAVTAVDDVFQGSRRQWWATVRAEL
ncbi:MAG: TonB-dependent receptor [Pseudomonadota bacterium]